jgi:type II secretory pathway component PulF
MEQFKYKAIDTSGNITDGILDSVDLQAAMDKMKELKLSPVTIDKIAGGNKKKQSMFASKNITKSDISNFTTRLAALLRASMPLAKAVESLKKQCDKETLLVLITDLYQQILEGTTLSDALASHPKYFPVLYINMVKVGEVGGVLDESLRRISEIRKRDHEMISKLKGALTYPVVMFIIMVGAIAILVGFVVPNFVSAFGDMGITLPLPTRILIALTAFCGKWWWAMLIIVALLIVGFIRFKKKEGGQGKLDKLMFKAPFIGKLIHEVSLSRFTLSLGSLLGSGVSLVKALEATVDVTGNEYIGQALHSLVQEVKEGQPLSDTFKKRNFFFPELAVEMTQTGEETGNLSEMLENLGDYYLEESNAKIALISTLMEPAIIVFLGVVVGFIVMAMMLPIFDISTSMH